LLVSELLAPTGRAQWRRLFTNPRGAVLTAHRRASAHGVVVSWSPRRVRARRGGREGAAVRSHPLRAIVSDARSKTPHGFPRSVEWTRLCRPPALAAGGAFPGRQPTSDVLCRHHGTFSSAPPTSALRRSFVLRRATSFTAAARSVFSSTRLRAIGSPLQDAFCRIAHDVLRPRRNSNADSTPRIEPLAAVHRVLVRPPIEG